MLNASISLSNLQVRDAPCCLRSRDSPSSGHVTHRRSLSHRANTNKIETVYEAVYIENIYFLATNL